MFIIVYGKYKFCAGNGTAKKNFLCRSRFSIKSGHCAEAGASRESSC